MSKDSRTSHFFVYPKSKDGQYTGHTIAVLLKDGRMFSGEALCNSEDQFSKPIGRKLAMERAIVEYEKDKKNRSKNELKIETSHYADYFNNDLQCIYEVVNSKCKDKQSVTIGASEFDKNWTNPDEVFVTLYSDGNGINVTHGEYKFRLNYSTAYELMLGIQIMNPNSKLEKIK